MAFFCFSLFILILCLPFHEKHKHFLVWEHFVSAHGEATALNKESIFVSLCLFEFNVFLFIKRIKLSCLGTRCFISWSSYGLKQGISWIFLFLFVYIIIYLLVHKNHKHVIFWAHVVSAHGEATALNSEFLGICFVSLCLYYLMSSCS